MPSCAPSIIAFTEEVLGLSLSVPQRTLLRCVYGEELDHEEFEIFRRCTGRESYAPGHPFSEVTVIAGARSGKDSRVVTPVVVYESLFGGHEHHLIPGEPSRIVLVAQDRDAAGIAFSYIKAAFERPMLAARVERVLAREIKLTNGLTIQVFPCTQRSMRGYSIPVGVLDELAFYRLEGSADSDVEIQTSVRRGMIALPSPKLVKVSTPYMKSGLLYDDHKNYFGTDSQDVLVWTAPSALMNPLITADRLAREARVTDPLRYRREYEAEFAEDISTFLSAAWIESAVQLGVHEIPSSDGIRYTAAVDTSGGGSDAFTLAVVSAEGSPAERRVVQAVMRGWEKPRGSQVSLEGAVEQIATIVKSYGLKKIFGDRYAGRIYIELFNRHGIEFSHPVVRETKDLHPLKDAAQQAIPEVYMDRSMIYLEAEALFASGRISILDHPKLLRELRNLERRPSQGGKDKIDHPRGQHDDYANALCLAAVMARGGGGLPKPKGGAAKHQGGPFGGGTVGRGGSNNMYDNITRA